MTRNSFFKNLEMLRELRISGAPLSVYREKYEEVTGGKDIADIYCNLSRNNVRSTVYTPMSTAEVMAKSIVSPGKVLDACSGTGNLTLALLDKFKREGFCNIDITCIDEDVSQLLILKERAWYLGYSGVKTVDGDFLSHEGKYDIIISNPPYEGHKELSPSERKDLRLRYPGIYINKGDLYYAFFPKAHSLLNKGGILSFIVSRYFLEADSARGLRNFLLSGFTILSVTDYYGVRPFSAGVDPVVITLKKEAPPECYEFPAVRGEEKFYSRREWLSDFSMTPVKLEEHILKETIRNNTVISLGEAGEFHQGIITGCDRAFIMTEEDAEKSGVELELSVPWIKNRHVRDGIKNSGLLLFYPPVTEEAKMYEKYPGFMKHIMQFKERLRGRREVKKGRINWYNLQWGRRKDLFEGKRVIFPYKGEKGRFTVAENVFHSADIYSYTTNFIPYEVLIFILTSEIYEKYIKLHLKKLGNNLFDYYPSRLSNVLIPSVKTMEEAQEFIKNITSEYNERINRIKYG